MKALSLAILLAAIPGSALAEVCSLANYVAERCDYIKYWDMDIPDGEKSDKDTADAAEEVNSFLRDCQSVAIKEQEKNNRPGGE